VAHFSVKNPAQFWAKIHNRTIKPRDQTPTVVFSTDDPTKTLMFGRMQKISPDTIL
jgi:hypothetical protein